MSNLKFSDLPFKLDILNNLSSLGYELMTPIQVASLPQILQGNDVTAHAKTGSGKTASFALGILSKLDISKKNVQALVLCPTRELSEQVSKEMRKLARFTPNIKITTLCGGSPMPSQVASLNNIVHCVVGTPGRICDHIRRGTIRLESLETLVFDEADRMLEMGFLDELTQIVNKTPKTRQTLLFSATYPQNIQSLSKNFQKDPTMIEVDIDHSSLNIEHLFFEKSDEDDFWLALSILSHYQPESTLIFCNTKQKCHDLTQYLKNKGYFAHALHGDLDQRERDEALVLFSNKSLSVLVATDVAARGLDIKDLSAVINFDLAHDPQIHVHRIGRTARAGRKGLAFSLFNSYEQNRIAAIENFQNKKIDLGDIEALSLSTKTAILPQMASIRISCGRKNKLRAGDILGALTANSRFIAGDVGKIDICETHSFVAVNRAKTSLALKVLTQEKVKGQFLKAMILA